MAYTKSQLIDAYCRATGYNADVHGTKQEYVQAMKTQADAFVSNQRTQIQSRLDQLPLNGLEQMKRVALKQLAEEQAEQARLDNAGVEL